MNAIHRGLYAYPPGDSSQAGAGPRRGHARDLRGRQDRHGEDQEGRDVLQAGQPRGRRPRTSSTRSSAPSPPTSPTATPAPTSATSSARPKEPGDYKEIPGIETPDDQTIVFKLTKGTGAALAGALAMPISVPVPKEYAEKYDKETPSTYGEGHAVYTGPYMVESDAEGKAIGYVAGKRIHLVRNPDYAARRRLPPGVPGRDRHPGRQRRHGRRDPAHPVGREHGSAASIEPPASQLKRCSRATRPSCPRSRAAAGA